MAAMRPVLNAVAVVEQLALDGPLGVGDLARRTGLPKSTAQRCLETLAAAGWIEVAVDAGPGALTAWRLSDRFTALVPSGPDLAAAALPHMIALRDLVGDAVHLVALEGEEIVLVQRVPGPGPIQVVLPLGARLPAYATATGKAILAFLPDAELAAHLPRRVESLTAHTVASRAALRAELAQVREQGWATNRGEWDTSVCAVAAPVVVDGAPVASVSVSSTPSRLPPSRTASVAAEVIATATRVAEAVQRR